MTNSGASTKVDIIRGAYSQLRISGLTLQPSPDDLELALARLENMAAELEARGIATEYNFEDEPDPNSDSLLPRGYWHGFECNLAVRLVPDFNKNASPVLFAQAAQSISVISAISAKNKLQQVSYPNRQPVGSGNIYTRWQRFYRQPNPSAGNTQMVLDDVSDYVEHYDSWLNADDNEVISSFSIVVDSGLTLESSSSTDNDVNYRLKASQLSSSAQVTIIVTTSTGRVSTRYKYFTITEN
jgi:hypothetical protein